MEEQLLKPADVAEILQISKAQAYSMLKRGAIPIVRIGTLVRIRPKDLEQYIDENANSKTAPGRE